MRTVTVDKLDHVKGDKLEWLLNISRHDHLFIRTSDAAEGDGALVMRLNTLNNTGRSYLAALLFRENIMPLVNAAAYSGLTIPGFLDMCGGLGIDTDRESPGKGSDTTGART